MIQPKFIKLSYNNVYVFALTAVVINLIENNDLL